MLLFATVFFQTTDDAGNEIEQFSIVIKMRPVAGVC